VLFWKFWHFKPFWLEFFFLQTFQPVFKQDSTGRYVFQYSPAARAFLSDKKQREIVQNWTCKSERDVQTTAAARLWRLGGNPANTIDLLGEYELQFGNFRGKTFRWLVENGLGYAAFIGDSVSKGLSPAPISQKVSMPSSATWDASAEEGQLFCKKRERRSRKNPNKPGPSRRQRWAVPQTPAQLSPQPLLTENPWKSCEIIHGKFTGNSKVFNAIFMAFPRYTSH